MTEEGTVSVLRLLDTATTVPFTAGWVRTTVQTVLPLLVSDIGAHVSELNWEEAARLRFVVRACPLSVAVTVA